MGFTPLLMPHDSGMNWATGNMTTCNAQGYGDAARCIGCRLPVYASALISTCDQICTGYWWSRCKLRKIEVYIRAFQWCCASVNHVCIRAFCHLDKTNHCKIGTLQLCGWYVHPVISNCFGRYFHSLK